jgi:hypothetical protein
LSLVDIPENYSLEYALRAKKERMARMNTHTPQRANRVPLSPRQVTDVDLGTQASQRQKAIIGQIETNRVRAELRVIENERRQLKRWCQLEIWRCKREIEAYKCQSLRLKHGRTIGDEVSEQAKTIIASVLEKYGITEIELLARPIGVYKFVPGVSKPLHEVAWRLYKETNPQLSLRQIGSILDRNPTSILHSVRTHQYQIDYSGNANPPPAKCATCGKEWVADKKIRKYCSMACSNAQAGARGGITYKPKTCEAV